MKKNTKTGKKKNQEKLDYMINNSSLFRLILKNL